MFVDPQVVTVAAVPLTLPRVGSGNPTRVGTFQDGDQINTVTINQNSTANRFRREFRFSRKKVAADPVSAVNKEVSASVIIAIDEPRVGFTDQELIDIFTGVVTALQANTNGKLKQLLGGEL